MKIITAVGVETMDIWVVKVSSIKKIIVYRVLENAYVGECQIYCKMHLISEGIFDICFEIRMPFNDFLYKRPFVVEFDERFVIIDCMNCFPPIGEFVAI